MDLTPRLLLLRVDEQSTLGRATLPTARPLCSTCHALIEIATGWRLGRYRRPCIRCGERTMFRVYLVTP